MCTEALFVRTAVTRWIAACSLLLGAVAAPAARAQDEVAPQEAFSLDTVFVSRFQASDPSLRPQADAARVMLERRLGSEFIVLARDEVPAFEDYSAEVYLSSCPPDQFFGCAFVIGERASAQWVITGELTDGLDGPQVDLSFVDVADSRLVFSFSAEWSDSSAAVFGDTVADLLGKIVAGAAVERDIREESAEQKAKRERDEIEALRQSLAGVEDELGALERSLVVERIEAPKLTEEQLRAYRESEEAPPWERLGMSESTYVRYRNSGMSLARWRELSRGRSARVLVAASAGTAVGPWSQEFDGRRGLDNSNLQPIEIDQWQEVSRGEGLLLDLELGFGILPELTAYGSAAYRIGRFDYRFFNEVEGQTPPDVPEVQTAVLDTWQWAGRLEFAPFPTWTARPTLTGGLAFWAGRPIQKVSQLPASIQPMATPNQVFLELGPGGEMDLGRSMTLFIRGMFELPVAGNRIQEYSEGRAVLTTRADPDGKAGLGVQLSAGLRVRIGPLWESRAVVPSLDDSDEPDEP
jgi:hypothetical protein